MHATKQASDCIFMCISKERARKTHIIPFIIKQIKGQIAIHMCNINSFNPHGFGM